MLIYDIVAADTPPPFDLVTILLDLDTSIAAETRTRSPFPTLYNVSHWLPSLSWPFTSPPRRVCTEAGDDNGAGLISCSPDADDTNPSPSRIGPSGDRCGVLRIGIPEVTKLTSRGVRSNARNNMLENDEGVMFTLHIGELSSRA